MHPPMVGSHDGPSHEIEEAAMACLYKSPYRAMRRISCMCEDGVLFLRGHLLSFYEAQVAQEAVAKVTGVVQVVNEVKIG